MRDSGVAAAWWAGLGRPCPYVVGSDQLVRAVHQPPLAARPAAHSSAISLVLTPEDPRKEWGVPNRPSSLVRPQLAPPGPLPRWGHRLPAWVKRA